MAATPPDHAQPTLRGEDAPSSYDDPNVITIGHARDVARGFDESRDRVVRRIAAQTASGDLTGLDDPIRSARRYGTLAMLWTMYADHGAGFAALAAGRMIYRAVERSEVDTVAIEAARTFLGDIHEQHIVHDRVLRCITHGTA